MGYMNISACKDNSETICLNHEKDGKCINGLITDNSFGGNVSNYPEMDCCACGKIANGT